jgi:hypothetical protein
MASRQYEQARRFFAKATQLDKHNAHAWIGFGHAFAEQVGMLTAAVQQIARQANCKDTAANAVLTGLDAVASALSGRSSSRKEQLAARQLPLSLPPGRLGTVCSFHLSNDCGHAQGSGISTIAPTQLTL